MSMALHRETFIHPAREELAGLAALQVGLDGLPRSADSAILLGPNGEKIAIPESAFHALRLIVEAMVRGQTMTLIPQGKELTTQQAAEILHMSRPHLTKLLEAGEIPFHRVGTHRRIAIEDVLEYRDISAETRRKALGDLTQLSQELGLYD